MFGKNRDRGDLISIFFVLVLDLPPVGTGETSQLFVFINFWSWRKKIKKIKKGVDRYSNDCYIRIITNNRKGNVMTRIPFLNTDVEECISVRGAPLHQGTNAQLAIIRSKYDDNMYYRIQKSKNGCTHSITLNKEEMKKMLRMFNAIQMDSFFGD